MKNRTDKDVPTKDSNLEERSREDIMTLSLNSLDYDPLGSRLLFGFKTYFYIRFTISLFHNCWIVFSSFFYSFFILVYS